VGTAATKLFGCVDVATITIPAPDDINPFSAIEWKENYFKMELNRPVYQDEISSLVIKNI
jgi:hypothetical protein